MYYKYKFKQLPLENSYEKVLALIQEENNSYYYTIRIEEELFI
jgi:hypothetical protein